MARRNKEIQLTSYQDLLGIEDEAENSIDKIVELPISDLYDFQNHPFHVNDDGEMMELVKSIGEHGVLHCMTEKDTGISGDMANQLKKHSEEGKLNELAVELILCSSKSKPVKVTLPEKRIKQYFPKEYSRQQIEEVIYELLEQWKQGH